MKKTLLYLLLLLVLIAGLYLVFGRQQGFSDKEANFTIRDTGNISKIYLVDRKGQSILLEREADGWKLNKDYKAMSSPVVTLLTTLRQQEAKAPVPQKSHNTIVTALATSAVKVEVYDREGKKIRVFYVGGETRDFDGSYMLMEGAERPYVVEIPGFPGYLSTRYSTTFLDWRDRSIFMIKKEDIKRASIQYPAEPLNSFSVNQDKNGNVTVEADPSITMNKEMNKRRVDLFLSFFDKVYSEGFVTKEDQVDAVLDTIPKRAIIDVQTHDGKNHHVDIYWRPIDRRSKNLIRKDPNTPEQFDADRGYGVINNNKDTVAIQYQAFDKIFRYAWELFEKDEKPATP
jgi:hypothetical protein